MDVAEWLEANIARLKEQKDRKFAKCDADWFLLDVRERIHDERSKCPANPNNA